MKTEKKSQLWRIKPQQDLRTYGSWLDHVIEEQVGDEVSYPDDVLRSKGSVHRMLSKA
jgi:hypothetical protein